MLTLTRVARAAAMAALAATLVAGKSYAETPAPQWPDADTVRAIIFDRSAAHGVNPYRMLCVANKESRLNPLAVNRLSNATGIMQWLPPYGGGNAWDWTTAAKQGISIWREYAVGNTDAVWFDIDMAAELFERKLERIHWPETIRGC